MKTHMFVETEGLMQSYETVRVDKNGQIILRQKHTCTMFVEDLGGGAMLEMVAIPAGMFMMGTSGYSPYADEKPSHHVGISAFLMGKYPVTQQQWKAVMKTDKPYRTLGSARPADRISWKDASEFCRRLSKHSGKPYRLPSEAEWEYACRAGTSTAFHCGETLTTDLANYVGEHTYQLEPKGIYRHGSTEVGAFPPNAFGLYDLHGNVWEWCADDWHDDYSGAPSDGSLWQNRHDPACKVLRGGSWHEPPVNCRSATRLRMNEQEGEDFFGFRVVL